MNKHDKSHLTFTYAQTQPRTVAGGLRPHLYKAGLRPEPGLEQLESAEQIDSFGEIDCGFYLEGYVRCTYLFVCFMICPFSARLDFLVSTLQANHINRFHIFDRTKWCHFRQSGVKISKSGATRNTRQNAYYHCLYLLFVSFIGTI